MPHGDPYERSPPFVYECTDCNRRIEAATQPERCPDCGADVRDLSVPRE
ncbi:MAG: rubrerythrin-like domain-containing protein [Haloarculaceae archaeon]